MKEPVQLIAAELSRAEHALKAAKSLIRDGLFADSITRSYYGVFHAARACLLHTGHNASTHKGVFALFYQHLIKTGMIEEEYGQILKEEKEERLLSDYAVEEQFDYERAKSCMEDSEKFILRIKSYLIKKR